jgi:hypothetical protein
MQAPQQPPQLIRTLNENRWMDGKIEMYLRSLDRFVVDTHGIWQHVLERDHLDPQRTVLRKTYRNGILVLTELDTYDNLPDFDPDFVI